MRDVEAHFGKHRNHAVVATAQRLRQGRGVSYDAVMSLAVHLKDGKTLAEAVPFQPLPATLDARWTVAEARLFLDQARRFAKEKALPFPVLIDAQGAVSLQFQAGSIPTTVVLDKQGRAAAMASGYSPDLFHQIETVTAQLVKE